MTGLDQGLLDRALRDRREAIERAERAEAALREVVASLVPRYDPDHPEDHGFSVATAAAIRDALETKR